MSEKQISQRCNKCQNSTNHKVIFNHKTEWDDETLGDYGNVEYVVDGKDHYAILECLGCGEIQFLHSSYFSECPEDGWNLTSYPPRIARKKPGWMNNHFSSIPTDISQMLGETYIALQNNIPALAIIGTRTVLDMVMTDKIGDKNSFKEKINDFAKNGYIASNLVDTLTNALDAGSASAHRGYKADSATIGKIFDIVEGVIHTVYILPSHSDAIKKKTPQRRKKKK